MNHLLHEAAESMHPIKWYPPSACANEWSEFLSSTENLSFEINNVPEVPSERLHPPEPTVPVPTAAAALSPAPATTLSVPLIPSSDAI